MNSDPAGDATRAGGHRRPGQEVLCGWCGRSALIPARGRVPKWCSATLRDVSDDIATTWNEPADAVPISLSASAPSDSGDTCLPLVLITRVHRWPSEGQLRRQMLCICCARPRT